MSYAPKSLRDLGAFYASKGGINLGIVGDTAHRVGYHLGRDRIYGSAGRGDDDYSVQHPRDKAGLSGAASAIDLGRLKGSLDELYAFSRWLVEQCQAGAFGSRDIREIIYSPDGQKVQRYSGIDGGIHTGDGNGDQSHLTHTHISYFRDSEPRSKEALFAPYWEDDMPAVEWHPLPGGDGFVTLEPTRGLVNLINGKRYVPDEATFESFCRADAHGIGKGYMVRDEGVGCLALEDACVFTPTDPTTAPSVLTGDDGSEYRRV